jgi:hypothetical protein
MIIFFKYRIFHFISITSPHNLLRYYFIFASLKFPRISTYTFFHSSVNFCSRTKCLGAFGRYFNRKYKKNKNYFFLLGVTENGITQKKVFLIFFKLDKLVEDYHSLLSSKPLEYDFCGLEVIDF